MQHLENITYRSVQYINNRTTFSNFTFSSLHNTGVAKKFDSEGLKHWTTRRVLSLQSLLRKGSEQRQRTNQPKACGSVNHKVIYNQTCNFLFKSSTSFAVSPRSSFSLVNRTISSAIDDLVRSSVLISP